MENALGGITHLRLSTEYGMHPVWGEGPGQLQNIDPEDLPVSDKLKRKLELWAGIFEKTYDRADPYGSGFATPAAEAEHIEMGKTLVDEVERELKGRFSVSLYPPG